MTRRGAAYRPTVLIRETVLGTVTDFEGNFSIIAETHWHLIHRTQVKDCCGDSDAGLQIVLETATAPISYFRRTYTSDRAPYQGYASTPGSH